MDDLRKAARPSRRLPRPPVREQPGRRRPDPGHRRRRLGAYPRHLHPRGPLPARPQRRRRTPDRGDLGMSEEYEIAISEPTVVEIDAVNIAAIIIKVCRVKEGLAVKAANL